MWSANAMWQRWWALHKVIHQAALPVLKRLPYRAAYRCLGALGRLDLLALPGQARRYEAAVAEGARKLGCDWDVPKVSRALARQTYRWRTRDLLFDSPAYDRVSERFRVAGRDRLDAAMAEGRGVILLANHFGSHVLIAHWAFREGYPLRWFGEKPRNVSKFLSDHLRSEGPLGQDKLFLSRSTSMTEAASAVVRVSQILKAGMIAFMASDVRWGDAKVAPAQFLGRTENFASTWVTLAAMTGAAVVPVYSRMDESGACHLDFREPLRVPPDGARKGRAVDWVQKAIDDLEDQVRRFPEQSNDYFFWTPQDEERRRRTRGEAVAPAAAAADEASPTVPLDRARPGPAPVTSRAG
jgi:phosphatidylinositol dimannoside acyltransferase